MFNRRQLLIGTAATAAVVACPSVLAAETSPCNRKVLDNVLRMLEGTKDESWPSFIHPLNIKINTSLITRYPDLFPIEQHIFSSCPCNLFIDPSGDRAAFVVCTRWLRPAFKMELWQDIKAIANHGGGVGYDIEGQYIDMIVDELASDILQVQERMRLPPYGHQTPFNAMVTHMFSYQPVIAVTDIDSNTFGPIVKFKTRYTVAPVQYRILSAEEDQQIEKRKIAEFWGGRKLA